MWDAESIEEFVTALKNLSLSCDLGDLRETLVRDMFIAGLNINNRGIKEKLLQEDCLTLEKAIQIAKSVEITQQQAQQLTKKSEAMVQRIKRMGQESKGYEKFKKSQTGMSTAAQVTSPEGIDYRRNRHHILKPNSTNDEPNNTQEKKDLDEKQDLSGTSSPNLSNCIPEKPSSSNGITTRSGRKIIKPRRFTFTEDDASVD
ncbi:hypothetical protein QE152_g15711 [Popillia japonica]|uniref:Neurotrophin-3 n=1 Tax=Popillia japonica TaxID=7064 RepID=A0AAW1L7D8_POPJA